MGGVYHVMALPEDVTVADVIAGFHLAPRGDSHDVVEPGNHVRHGHVLRERRAPRAEEVLEVGNGWVPERAHAAPLAELPERVVAPEPDDAVRVEGRGELLAGSDVHDAPPDEAVVERLAEPGNELWDDALALAALPEGRGPRAVRLHVLRRQAKLPRIVLPPRVQLP